MSASVFDHPWLGGLFADPDMAALWSAERQLAHMLAFEAAWSRARGACGLSPAEDAEAAARAIEGASLVSADLAKGMGRDGVPVPVLAKLLRKGLSGPVAKAVHSGATSQDVVDTALALTLRDTTHLLLPRLEALDAALADLSARFGTRPLMARTRMQAATEVTVADRIRPWRQPLAGLMARLSQAGAEAAVVQVGGASGDRGALGEQAQPMTDHIAQALGLAPAQAAWHATRQGVVGYSDALSLITGSLGKMGQDVALMAQQGIGTIAMSGGGGSSAMPHKQNPVAAELLVTLARFNAVQVSAMHHALVHEQERSGSAWALEWMVLPQMAQAAGRALTAALTLIESVESMGDPG
ncbi:3-carboxy-cis,cis-muconate cycloisomerase [Acidimangrovimonas sediminis]|uniref:3-carboxy-cis,cis-muconate cycloisomerase n=1 Tax=Acidimangrovimonas sediminis TaxID=2056283 RepID=UPI000C7FEEEA|nr:3-carboxy-cis,cis-muconate cycloisomerase [Acidimangrovimonas sediminis]